MEHIVYADKKSHVLEKLLSGTKTVIVRGAAGRKLPYGRVFPGESLYFVENDGSGIIKAKGLVKEVTNTEKLTKEESIELIASLQNQLDLSPAQIQRWSGKRYLCLVEVEKVTVIPEIKFNRQKNMDDWITVEKMDSLTGDSDGNVSYESLNIEKIEKKISECR